MNVLERLIIENPRGLTSIRLVKIISRYRSKTSQVISITDAVTPK